MSQEDKPKGLRYNTGKPMFSTTPSLYELEVAKVFTEGLAKYGPRNWEHGMEYSKCYDSLRRHLFKWWSLGIDMDEEMPVNHLICIIANAAMLYEYTITHPELDDRPGKQLTNGEA